MGLEGWRAILLVNRKRACEAGTRVLTAMRTTSHYQNGVANLLNSYEINLSPIQPSRSALKCRLTVRLREGAVAATARQNTPETEPALEEHYVEF